jgi:curli biogenesis system outer membrane secretion channel CsgG
MVSVLVMVLVSAHAFADDAEPAKKPAVPMRDRPSLAVVSFDDGSIQRQTWWGVEWDVGNGLANILTTKLLAQERFRLLERSLLAKVIAEQDLGASARVDAKTAAKAGAITGADYLVMGKVTEFAWETKEAGGIGGMLGGIVGVGQSTSFARVSIDVRLVDAETTEILASFSGSGYESRGKLVIGHSDIGVVGIGSSDFMQSILGIATTKAITEWTDNFCKALDEKRLELPPKHRVPVRPDGVVLMVDGDALITNTGSAKGYAAYDRVEVHRKIRELRDPDTGEVLRVVTKRVGYGLILKIDDRTADIAFAADDPAELPVEGDVVKYAPEPEATEVETEELTAPAASAEDDSA